MMQVPKSNETAGMFEQRVTHMLQIRTLIMGVGRVGEILAPATAPLLQSTGNVSKVVEPAEIDSPQRRSQASRRLHRR